MKRQHVAAPNELKCYVCLHVFEDSRPILLVSRPEGDWCLLCGGEHPDTAGSYRVVGIGHLIERDSSLLEVTDLAADEEAERDDARGIWRRSRIGG